MWSFERSPDHQVTPNSRLPHAGLGKGGVEAAREFTLPLYASGLDYLVSTQGDGGSNPSGGAKIWCGVESRHAGIRDHRAKEIGNRSGTTIQLDCHSAALPVRSFDDRPIRQARIICRGSALPPNYMPLHQVGGSKPLNGTNF